jgi:predicted component of type VI protein secretion system
VTLTLEVTSPNGAELGAARRKTFGPEGGVLGRNKTNSWVLPNSKVSGRHAVITYDKGVFYIEDTSTNGVFVKSSRSRLGRGRPYALRTGDCLLIDPYVIEVSVSSAGEAMMNPAAPGFSDPFGGVADPFGGADPFASQDPFFDAPQPPAAPQSIEPGFGPTSGDEVDPLKLLGGSGGARSPLPGAAARRPLSADDLEGASPLRGHYQAPPVPASAPAPRGTEPPGNPFVIPEDYDPLSDNKSGYSHSPAIPAARKAPSRPPVVQEIPPAPRIDPFAAQPRPVAPVAPRAEPDFFPPAPDRPMSLAPPPAVANAAKALAASARSSVAGDRDAVIDLEKVLEGAGLRPEDVSPDLARDFGRILRVVVTGVMEVLRARHDLKGEFRLRTTQFRPADNNPLKFSANVDDALHNLLVKRNSAFLGPVDAFEDAFSDLRHHQIAMLAGMRTAFESMLAEFDPDRLQEDFDRQLKRGALLGKLKYWELYREHVAELMKDPEATFRRLFGEEFGKEYDAQLLRLKSADREPPGR